ncbi:MAG: twin-arginine translocation signal domain-containing protein, partial [Betaproteobacteria bacterium]|nr:twin-arginine translocation signal domain-containing protein [Betaproteobacteria bacterium]
MSNVDDTRRDFLKSAVLGGAAAAAATAPLTGLAQPAAKVPDGAPAKGYQYLRPAESAFVEALVDHMVPADALSPSGT